MPTSGTNQIHSPKLLARNKRYDWVIPGVTALLGAGGLVFPVYWFLFITIRERAGSSVSITLSEAVLPVISGLVGVMFLVLRDITLRQRNIEAFLSDLAKERSLTPPPIPVEMPLNPTFSTEPQGHERIGSERTVH